MGICLLLYLSVIMSNIGSIYQTFWLFYILLVGFGIVLSIVCLSFIRSDIRSFSLLLICVIRSIFFYCLFNLSFVYLFVQTFVSLICLSFYLPVGLSIFLSIICSFNLFFICLIYLLGHRLFCWLLIVLSIVLSIICLFRRLETPSYGNICVLCKMFVFK